MILLVILVTAIWVAFDASGRDFSQSKLAKSTAGWFFGTLLLWIIFFPAYLAARGKTPMKAKAA